MKRCAQCGAEHECSAVVASAVRDCPLQRKRRGGLNVQVLTPEGDGCRGVTVSAGAARFEPAATDGVGLAMCNEAEAGDYEVSLRLPREPVDLEEIYETEVFHVNDALVAEPGAAPVSDGYITEVTVTLVPRCPKPLDGRGKPLPIVGSNRVENFAEPCGRCFLSEHAKAAVMKMTPDRRKKLAAAFRESRFVYGTQGERTASRVLGRLVDEGNRRQKRAREGAAVFAHLYRNDSAITLTRAQWQPYFGRRDGDEVVFDEDLYRWAMTQDPGAPSITRLKEVFEPGVRAKSYGTGGLSAGSSVEYKLGGGDAVPYFSEMMDLYYGSKGSDTWRDRNDFIGEYVHHAMGFKGTWEKEKTRPGFDSFFDTYGVVDPNPDSWRNKGGQSGRYEGWDAEVPSEALRTMPDGSVKPDHVALFSARAGEAGMTATKYMSRVIREAIQCFGGSLVFEGAEVYYEAVFSTLPVVAGGGRWKGTVRESDTAAEARALFPNFVKFPNEPEVPFGNGTLVFNWYGEKIAPTQGIFEECWQFGGDTPEELARKQQAGEVASTSGPYRSGSSLAALNAKLVSEGKPEETCTPLWHQFPRGTPGASKRRERLDALGKLTPEETARVNALLAKASSGRTPVEMLQNAFRKFRALPPEEKARRRAALQERVHASKTQVPPELPPDDLAAAVDPAGDSE